MKTAILLLVVSLSAVMAVETGRSAGLARKLLGEVTYCDGKDDLYSCSDYEYCEYEGYAKCYPKRKCDDYCKRYDYKYVGDGYDKKREKYCAEYGKNCYTEQKCDNYCKRYEYKYVGNGYDKKEEKYCAQYGKECYDVQECKHYVCKGKKNYG